MRVLIHLCRRRAASGQGGSRRVIAVAVIVAALAHSAEAPAATSSTFTASVDPPAPGTAGQATPVAVGTEGKFASDAVGQAPTPVTRYTIAFPSTFTYRGDQRPTCPMTTASKGPGACPSTSELARGNADLTAQAGATSFPGKADLYLYNAGPGKLTMLFHLTDPTRYDLALTGTVTTEAGAFGPVLSIDTSPMTNGAPGTVHLQRVALNFLKGAAAPPAGGSQTKTSKRKRAYSRCVKRAKKLAGKKRKAALKKCRRLRHRKPKTPTSQSAQSQPSVFDAGPCPDGKWVIEGRFEFKDGTKQARDATVVCSGGSAPPPPQPQPVPCPLPAPLCPSALDWTVAPKGAAVL